MFDIDQKAVIANLATVFTVGVFLSGIQVCRKIIQKKSTADVSALPFICGFVSSFLWLRYGILVHDSALVIVNSSGCLLQSLYILCYGFFMTNKAVFVKQLVVAFSVLSVIFCYTSLWLAEEEAKRISGLSACTAAVLFMSSPLASAAHVIRTKSVECLPFYMILFCFIMASLWVWYGILLNDIFIQLPNFLGALVSGLQLCLYYTYRPTKQYFELAVSL